jgi:hypothetical protein
MARTTQLADEQYSAEFTEASHECRDSSSSWEEYDVCMAPWMAGADAVKALRNTTLALDARHGRKSFKSAACRWFEALSVLDTLSPSPLPAVKAGLNSRYTRRC